ncbi:hypothetical protein DDJ69_31820 [Klebsiella oxytoca]|nr:hypothetical protein DDJ69_31820 [Klebsiella oxytoca]
MMSQKFDELKERIQNIDKDQVNDLINQVKDARKNGEINEDEKQSLVDQAKEKIGGSFGL